MISFKEYLNELKIGSQADKYFNLIKKAVDSKSMKIDEEDDKLLVKYDSITLVFDREGYLVGFKEAGEYYTVSKDLKSIKDLRKETATQFKDKLVKDSKELKTRAKQIAYKTLKG